MVSAMATPTIFLLFCFFGFRIISATTHPGDAAALRKLRQIWKNTPPSWSDSEDPCGSPWDGIACTNSRVVKLTLPSAGLEGTLSDDIGQLSELESLDLSFNDNLTGPIPPAIGNLQKLKKLALPGCSFSGNIPPEISNMTNIESIFLSSNNLTGGIPPSIGRLANLRGLDVGDNHLSGPLPVSSGSTPGLDQLLNTEHFHFNKNQLSGSIPENLFNSNMSLIHLILDGNNFTGPIPVSIGLLQNLTVLRLSRNALTGAVPPSIRNLTRLKELNLAGNGFTGDVPDFTGMTALKYVDLSGNLFTPSLAPSWIFRLRSLTVLIMEYGGLIGGVPTEIFSLPQLQELILRNNKFNGTVDFGTAVGASLRFVDLRSNIITGMLNEPRVNSTTIRLRENPVCNAQIEKKDICQPEQETEKYSTVSACTKKCLVGQGNRPGSCNCAQPYAGTLSFGGPLLRDLRDSTRFQRLEGDLAGKLKLENGSVSLLNPVFDDDEYLHIRLELFPSDGDFFNRSEVQRLAFALSTQVYQPHDDEWGPYVFEGEIYIFGSGEPQGTSAAVIGGIAAGCVVLVAGLIAIGISAVRERRIAQRAKRITNPFAHWATNDEDAGSAPQLNGVRFISFSDVKKCTDGFSDENEIGVGGYGQVYKGKLPNGQMVAIKRAKQGSMQGALEFKTEIELLSRVHHTNLVRLVGFCYEKGEQMLIYEYIPNGTLGESLSGKLGIHLSWIDRLRIALGSARGLAYLHELADPPIIHRDVKTANILLDERLRPKVADFGLSKLVEDAAKTNAQTAVKGTRGYLDPEYYATQRLTDKSDVYSFGVVMLELLTGKRPIERNRYIVREVATALKSPDGLKEVVDPVIQNAPVLVGLEMFVGLAMRCVENYSEDRPTMRDVVKELEFILETNGGLFSRATSMASSLGEIRGLAARSRRSVSLSSTEISSNAFDRIAAAYSLPTTVVPK